MPSRHHSATGPASRGAGRSGMEVIDQTGARRFFSEIVGGALGRTRPEPSPVARAYLVDLLLERLREPGLPRAQREQRPAFGEALLAARLEHGSVRLARMRAIGDDALFLVGLFADSLGRSPVGAGYYRDIGRIAYADLSRQISTGAPAGAGGRDDGRADWVDVFAELAERFETFVEALAAVADRAWSHSPAGLLRLYTRYVEQGDEGARRRLGRIGGSLAPGRTVRWQ